MRKHFRQINSHLKLTPYAFLAFAIYQQLVAYFSRLGEPLLGMYEFRETQTALSAYWMAIDGPKIIYETPVLGAPYTIPFEFPFFQWAVALLTNWTPLPVDDAARTVSFIFFVVCLCLGYKIGRVVGFPRQLCLLFVGLLCLSPLYLYWSATSMIESTALAFSLAWLLPYYLFLQTRHSSYLLLATLFGTMAALGKITTFPPTVFVGLVLTLIHFYRAWKENSGTVVDFLRQNIFFASLLLLTVIVPILALEIWLHFSDLAKSQNSMSAALTSEALRTFNFGTLEQRLSIENWKKYVFGRYLTHILGSGWIVMLLLLSAFVRSGRLSLAVFTCVAAYILAPLLFWRLHQIHFYYQYANGIFLLFAAATAFYAAFQKQAAIATICLIATTFSMSSTFSSEFEAYMRPSNLGTAKRTIPPGQWIQANTSPDSALYVFGNDWSSHVHHYARRKGIAAMRSLSYEQLDSMLTNIPMHTGDLPLESILVCDRVFDDWKDENKPESRKTRLEEFLETRQFVERFDRCVLYQ